MNIQDASLMLRSGCFMRRGSWDRHKHCGHDGYGLFVKLDRFESSLRMHFVLDLDDLLADDWEAYIPAYHDRGGLPTFRPVSGKPDRPSFPSVRMKETSQPKNGATKIPLALKKR